MKKVILFVLAFALVSTVALAQTTEKKAEPVKPACQLLGKIAVQTVPAMNAVVVMEKAATLAPKEGYPKGMEGAGVAYSKMMEEGFGKLMAWIKTGGKPAGAPFGIYYEDPEKVEAKDLTCKVGFPVADKVEVKDDLKFEFYPDMLAVVAQYSGPYDASDNIWKAASKFIADDGYLMAGPCWEVYLKGPNDAKTPADYLTEIRIPVTKAPETKDAPKPEVKPAPAAPAGEKK